MSEGTGPSKYYEKPEQPEAGDPQASGDSAALGLGAPPRIPAVSVPISRIDIEYDPVIGQRSGVLQITDVPPGDPRDKGTLLHLLFFLIHTADGRAMLAAHRPPTGPGAPTEDEVRDRLKSALKLRFPHVAEPRLDAVVAVHFAADEYVRALNAREAAEQLEYQAQYHQKLILILGALHDDAMGHEFSMLW